MNRNASLFSLLAAVFLASITAAASPRISFSDLLTQNELNPMHSAQARSLAKSLDMPLRIILPSGILMEPLAVEDGKPVYAVIKNLVHPLMDGTAAYFDEIQAEYDLNSAQILYGNRTNDAAAVPRHSNAVKRVPEGGLLLVPDWTADKVLAFDPVTGNLVDTAFIPSTPVVLQSPKEARLSPWGFITVSDQISDLVQKFDTSGAYLGWFAPAGGVNNSILDNIRGHAYRPNGNLVVAVASGANSNSIAEFDSAGNYIGNFIPVGSGGLNSPFGILFRARDVLVTQSSGSQGVRRYDLNGNFISVWALISSFPQQIAELSDGRIAVANFSGTTGIWIFGPDSTFIKRLSGVTGNRGVYQIANGNFLTTNSSGIHEVDSSSGSLVRTIYPGANFQYIDLYIPPGNPTFTVSPTSILFPIVCVGSTRTDSVTVTNSGTASLTVSSVTGTDTSFTVVPTSVTIPASSSWKFYITFAPSITGTRVGSILFVHNAPGSPDTLSVQGIATAAPSVFQLLRPADGDTVTMGDTLRFVWRRPSGLVLADTASYRMEISTNGGSSWNLVAIVIRDTSHLFTIPNFPSAVMWRVYASAQCGGASCEQPFTFYPREPSDVESEHPALPRDFALLQNHPNPFNPSTTIRFDVPVESHVTLKVFDLVGREVITLVNEERSPGFYEIQLDASRLSSGVYFYRLQASDFVSTKRMVLIR